MICVYIVMVKYFCDVDSGIRVFMSFMRSSSYQVHHNSPLKYCTALLRIISLHPTKEEEEVEQWMSKSLQLRWSFGHCPDNRAAFSSLAGISGWIYSLKVFKEQQELDLILWVSSNSEYSIIE